MTALSIYKAHRSGLCVFIMGFVVALALQGCGPLKHQPSLVDLQGGWWSSCADPAAEFVIQDDKYFGDFSGIHPLALSGDTLTFKDGIVRGHEAELSNTPRAFRIVSVSPSALVLRPLPSIVSTKNWTLHSCASDAH